MSENVQVGSFYNYLISEGYYFDKKLVENYLLSLKVKPFEILTGNSGTGKTKLSQLFAKYLAKSIDADYSEDNKIEGYFTTKAKTNYSSWSNMGWTLSKEDFAKILPIRNCEVKCDMLVDNIPAEGSIDVGVQLYYDSEELKSYFNSLYDQNPKGVVDLNINCKDLMKISTDYEETNGSIVLTQKANNTAVKDRQWLLNYDMYNFIPFKRGFVDCRILVDDIYSDARLRVVSRLSFKRNKKLQDYLSENIGKEVTVELKIDSFDFDSFQPEFNCDKSKEQSETNSFIDDEKDSKYQIVPVGANWTDNTNIVGYYNVITEDYQLTPAYELIRHAQEDLDNPYFLILDEMNLSHVERYFADFLSAIESGEEIPLYGNNEKLELPDNLFIIGTVNVDETTYMFSPKVLDRANTIEFDTVPASDYMFSNNDFTDFEGDIEYLQSPLEDADVSNLNIEDLKEIFSKIYCDDDNLWDMLAIELTAFQETLKGSGFDFGFRVINEILRFMVVAWKYEGSPENWQNWERYFDAQIKQKILPKLHGSEKAIGNVLNNLFNLCLVDKNNNENPKNFYVTDENARYYTSALKLQNMAKVLSDQRYVSFIN